MSNAVLAGCACIMTVHGRQANLLAVIDEGVDEARDSEDSADDGAQAGQEGGERRPLLVEAHLRR